MMRIGALVRAVALSIAPLLGARGADLVVWWEKGWYAQEDEAIREIIAVFEQDTGKQIDLVHYSNAELPERIVAALKVGHPPDVAFGFRIEYPTCRDGPSNDRLVDLTDTVGFFSNLFDPDALAWYALLNETTGQRALYALPTSRASNHIHVWKNLLERAGFTHRQHSERLGGVLVVLVRSPGSAGGAPSDQPRRHLGRRSHHVGHGRRHSV